MHSANCASIREIGSDWYELEFGEDDQYAYLRRQKVGKAEARRRAIESRNDQFRHLKEALNGSGGGEWLIRGFIAINDDDEEEIEEWEYAAEDDADAIQDVVEGMLIFALQSNSEAAPCPVR